ncbi:uncharacterized protein ACA1_392920 [Acanthamoeba castellanii str. Neff]|uniref:Uncharacterized protein n=1 Tax=Acanthamoeba castellanii (strain ATCC 30010 / Neff) TaxID=1257118 RepID=L8H2Q0_ACACF|nr:uncharacterized protein ACA1_392920 [Acanthamoeba castellanii str. Neff]ELR18646.1 hypothetical protein ACA1_392920 [Acanthamoeba castellanii str. Neff]
MTTTTTWTSTWATSACRATSMTFQSRPTPATTRSRPTLMTTRPPPPPPRRPPRWPLPFPSSSKRAREILARLSHVATHHISTTSFSRYRL